MRSALRLVVDPQTIMRREGSSQHRLTFWRLLLTAVISISSLIPILSLAQKTSQCVSLNTTQETQVRLTVASRLAVLPSLLTIRLTGSKKPDCFWELEYSVRASDTHGTAYFDPVTRQLAFHLYDVTDDPEAQVRHEAEERDRALSSGAPPFDGKRGSPIRLVVFSDFECPFCRKFYYQIRQTLLHQDQMPLEIQYRNYPLAQHPWAELAAEYASCAALYSVGTYRLLAKYYFIKQATLTLADLGQRTKSFLQTQASPSSQPIERCVTSGQGREYVRADVELGHQVQVKATPTLFVNGALVRARTSAQLMSFIEVTFGKTHLPSNLH